MISIACAIWIGWAVPNLGALSYGQPSAVLWKDQLFVLAAKNPTSFETLYRGPFSLDRKLFRPPVAYGVGEVSANDLPCSQAKLEIRDGRALWFSAGFFPLIIPLADLPCLENSEFGVEVCKSRFGLEQYRLAWRYYPYDEQLLFPKHRKPDVQAPPARDEHYYQSDLVKQFMRELEYRQRARFDVQIAGPKSIRLFHAH